jgi:hypothetical protein
MTKTVIFGKRPGSSPIDKRGKKFQISVYEEGGKFTIDIYSQSGSRFYQTTTHDSLEECQAAYDNFLSSNF